MSVILTPAVPWCPVSGSLLLLLLSMLGGEAFPVFCLPVSIYGMYAMYGSDVRMYAYLLRYTTVVFFRLFCTVRLMMGLK